MYLAVELGSVSPALGAAETLDLARAIEEDGFDEVDLFDHVTMGHPTATRPPAKYPARMAILEPLVTLGAIAARTRRIRLGVEVLVLPQRQPALVAKQVATLDVLSGGRVRLGVGVGWQAAEYASLGVPFGERGRRMDEAIGLLRRYWSEPSVSFDGRYYLAEAMAMEPKPVRPGGPPIWIGGDSATALRRAGRVGDGWLADADEDAATVGPKVATVREAAAEAGRDPDAIGLQTRLTDLDDLDALAARMAGLRAIGFTWATISLPVLAAGGVRGVFAQREVLGRIKERIRRETGEPPPAVPPGGAASASAAERNEQRR